MQNPQQHPARTGTAYPAPTPKSPSGSGGRSVLIALVVALPLFYLWGGATPYILSALGDWLSGAALTSQWPFAMWLFWGAIWGACLGFWLEAPLYGLKKSRPLLLVIPLLAMVICGSLAAHRQAPPPSLSPPTPPPPPPPIPPNFAGTWQSNWGDMTLRQDGDQVAGNYNYRGGQIRGSVRRASDGTSVLNFYWSNTERSGQDGVGFFALAGDANSFRGDWNESNDFSSLNPNGTRWSATRLSAPPPPPMFTGTWETPWGEMKLAQGVTRVNGTYGYGGGLIDGTLLPDGKTLSFMWTNRVTGESGRGKFTLTDFGNAFSGTWGQGEKETSPGASWNGVKRSS